ncbi:TPA: methionyl-tRNA formyltransferase [Candidatus Dojkabacteria bacterium]|uniref:Methionyl-tRNA formyltransferase n=1 Tax=Candidatus Dojkabacteria bacterium TaxID=2099670 RepID=A0A832QE47_9BACT|nr:methionyl-tRNA formyltransferase [Candidatus Dojkabacteria bacterium]
MDKVKTIFLGSGWESVETLKILHESEVFEVVCVITTVDRPVGRKQVMTPSDVKKYAWENNIPVEHTESKKERYMDIANQYQPDTVVCKAFGEIVPKEFLEYPKYGCINIHFSILPKYRGAVPIQKAILDGEKETGISIMLMSEGLDEGDVLDIYKEEIKPKDTNISLRERLVKKSAEILLPVLKEWIDGKIVPEKQDNSRATYCWQKDISKEKAEIKWDMYEPEYIERMVRAFLPWPVAWTRLPKSENKNLSEKIMKIYKVELINCKNMGNEVGKLFVEGEDLLFTTKHSEKCLKLVEFQIEGRNITNSTDFLKGLGRHLLH